MQKPRDLTLKGKIGAYSVLTIFTLFAIYPILRIFTISLRPGDRLLSKSLALIPPGATLNTYVQLFTEEPFLQWLMNSIIIAVRNYPNPGVHITDICRSVSTYSYHIV
jgi:arabinogalactan oligomer/maltooligosaccharide transport system permease protein